MTITMSCEDAESIQNLIKRMRSENQALLAAARNVLEILENGINGEPVSRTVMASCVIQLLGGNGEME